MDWLFFIGLVLIIFIIIPMMMNMFMYIYDRMCIDITPWCVCDEQPEHCMMHNTRTQEEKDEFYAMLDHQEATSGSDECSCEGMRMSAHSH